MENISALKQSLAEYLRRHALAGRQTAVVEEFPAQGRAVPLNQAAVAVGVEQVELKEGAFGGLYGDSGGGPLYGRTAEITVYFDLYCPPEQGGAGCHSLYERLCDALLLGDCPFGFYRMWCGGVAFSREAGGHHLRVGAALRAAVTRADSAPRVREFQVRRQEESAE